MLELHYPTPTKTILKRQYPGKPTLKVAFGNIWQRRHFRKLLEVARFSFRGVTMAKFIGTNKLPSSPQSSFGFFVLFSLKPLDETTGEVIVICGLGSCALKSVSVTLTG